MVLSENIVRHVKVGHVLSVPELNVMDEGRGYTNVKYKVVAVFPYHVVVVNRHGSRRSICYGDLVIMGYEKQILKYEALKHEQPVHPATGIQVIDKKGRKRGRKRKLL